MIITKPDGWVATLSAQLQFVPTTHVVDDPQLLYNLLDHCHIMLSHGQGAGHASFIDLYIPFPFNVHVFFFDESAVYPKQESYLAELNKDMEFMKYIINRKKK